ncbi:MAG TPA: outer membrane beta-barrel protein, partial [Cyclobacteriaceae bacterium]|nr:outer membrane beta-barrel protein [Cyclobacteriaceae bacterium]
YELSYSTFIKGTSLNFSTFVRNTYDAIQSVKTPLPGGAIQTTYDNIGHENAYGGSVFANVNIGSKLSLNGGFDVYYAVLENNVPDELYNASNEGWVMSGRLFGNYTLSKGWGLQFFGFARGRDVQLQGTRGNFRMYSLAVKKDFNDKKGSIGFGAENFLTPSMKLKNDFNSTTLQQKSVNELFNMNFKINFSYRIGKMSFDNQPRKKRSVNNDDLKQGGDNGMDGGAQGGMDGASQWGVSQGQGRRGATAAAASKPAKLPDANPTAEVNAVGTWAYTINSPQGGEGTLTINKETDQYNGTIFNKRFNKEFQLSSVTVKGNELTFSYEAGMGGNQMTISVKAIITGDDMAGNMTVGQFGTFPINAKRSQ